MSKSENQILKKTTWTEDDFEIMNWHDCKVWAMMSNADEWEYLFDLDYIFGSIAPTEDEKYYKIWVAPVTIVFVGTSDVKLDVNSHLGDINIAKLFMENPRKTMNPKFTEYTFRFDSQEGEFSLNATGYQMFVRQKTNIAPIVVP